MRRCAVWIVVFISLCRISAVQAQEVSLTADGARENVGGDGSGVAPSALRGADREALQAQVKKVVTDVDALKEDTFSTKSRLLLLRDEVLQRSVSGARFSLRHKNAMGGQYEMVEVSYQLDNEPVFNRRDKDGALNRLDDEEILDRVLSPGTHQLYVVYVYKGRPWGVFRYMDDYTFRVESGYEFTVYEGKSAQLTVTASERGNFFTAYEKRPGVTYQLEQSELTADLASDKEALPEE